MQFTFLEQVYPAEPKEVENQEALYWDDNKHIENLFQAIKEGYRTLLQMNALRRTDIDQTYVKYVYNTI